MFLKVFYYFILAFLIINSLQAFSSPACEVGAFSNSRFHRQYGSVIGIESYRQLLVRLARSSLGVDDLSPQQMEALENYHSVVRGEKGKDGTPTRVGNYTLGQRRKIIRYLESKGFSREQINTLMEDGVVEIERLYSSKINTRKVVQRIKNGKPTFIATLENNTKMNSPMKISRLLEETDHGLLVEVEQFNTDGVLYRTKKFFTDTSFSSGRGTKHFFDLERSARSMTKILEKTDSGFVISVGKDRNVVFLSFEQAIENGLLPKNPTTQDYLDLENLLNKYMDANKGDSKLSSTEQIDQKKLDKPLKNIFRSTKPQDSQYTSLQLENPEFEAVFSAVSSTRKKISSDELDLPPSTNRVAQLAEQGYKASYTEGLDQMNEWAAVRRRIQELKANPRTTHIEYFADQIPNHIAHIRKGLDSLADESKNSQLKTLKKLEEEAQEAIRDEEVTYEWWLKFNTKLTDVMAGKGLEENSYFSMISKSQEDPLSFFPLTLIVPTIKGEDIGIMAFNRAASEGVYPVGVINKNTAVADQRKLDPIDFLEHDLGHSSTTGNQSFRGYSAGHRLFHKRLLKNIENLPPEERKKAEAIYFIMAHETGGFNLSSPIGNMYQNTSQDYRDQKKMRDYVAKRIRSNFAGILKLPKDSAEEKKKVEALADSFMEVYNRAQQHQ